MQWFYLSCCLVYEDNPLCDCDAVVNRKCSSHRNAFE